MMKTIFFSVSREEKDSVLQDFLSAHLNVSRRKAKDLLDSRNVLVNRKRVWMARHILKQNDKVEILQNIAPVEKSDAPDVIFEDNEYIIINKPAGILSSGPDSAESIMASHLNNPQICAVHRLDRDTSGCLMLAKSAQAFDAAVNIFQEHTVKKIYHVIVAGRFDPPEQTVNHPIDGQFAKTSFRLLDGNDEASHILAKIETGRTHQIRKHLSSIFYPVIGDRHYGTRNRVSEKALRVGRQMLHSSVIELINPFTDKMIRAKAQHPRDFRNCLRMYNLT